MTLHMFICQGGLPVDFKSSFEMLMLMLLCLWVFHGKAHYRQVIVPSNFDRCLRVVERLYALVDPDMLRLFAPPHPAASSHAATH